MILAAIDEGCLAEVLVIAAALELQDPLRATAGKAGGGRQRPRAVPGREIDFLVPSKIWDFYHGLKETLSRSQLQKACRQNFLSSVRMREWLDVHRELMEIVQEERGRKGERERVGGTSKTGTNPRSVGGTSIRGLPGLRSPTNPARPCPSPTGTLLLPAQIRRHPSRDPRRPSFRIAQRGDGHEYTIAHGGKAVLWPGSGLFRGSAKWIVAAEQIETTRRYLRCWRGSIPAGLSRWPGTSSSERTATCIGRSKWASATALESAHALRPDNHRRAAGPLRANRPRRFAAASHRARPGAGRFAA